MTLAAIAAATMAGSLGSGVAAQDVVAQSGFLGISRAYETPASTGRKAQARLAQYDNKLDTPPTPKMIPAPAAK